MQPSSVIGWGGSESLSVSADALPFHCTRNLFLPLLLLEEELTAVQINQRDLINLAPAHISDLETRQAINSANYLLLERQCGGWKSPMCCGPLMSNHPPPPTDHKAYFSKVHPHFTRTLFTGHYTPVLRCGLLTFPLHHHEVTNVICPILWLMTK